MKDAKIKRLIAEAILNKDLIYEVLGSQRPEDIINGDFYFHEYIINRTLRDVVMNNLDSYLTDYSINFIDNHILISAEADIKQLGAVSLNYKIKMLRFSFGPGGHNLALEYKEDAKSRGNMMQATVLKLAASKQPLIKTALDHLDNDAIKVTDNIISLDLDKLAYSSRIPKDLAIRWLGCGEGKLHLYFKIDERHA